MDQRSSKRSAAHVERAIELLIAQGLGGRKNTRLRPVGIRKKVLSHSHRERRRIGGLKFHEDVIDSRGRQTELAQHIVGLRAMMHAVVDHVQQHVAHRMRSLVADAIDKFYGAIERRIVGGCEECVAPSCHLIPPL